MSKAFTAKIPHMGNQLVLSLSKIDSVIVVFLLLSKSIDELKDQTLVAHGLKKSFEKLTGLSLASMKRYLELRYIAKKKLHLIQER